MENFSKIFGLLSFRSITKLRWSFFLLWRSSKWFQKLWGMIGMLQLLCGFGMLATITWFSVNAIFRSFVWCLCLFLALSYGYTIDAVTLCDIATNSYHVVTFSSIVLTPYVTLFCFDFFLLTFTDFYWLVDFLAQAKRLHRETDCRNRHRGTQRPFLIDWLTFWLKELPLSLIHIWRCRRRG